MSNPTYGFLALALRQRLIKRWSLMHSLQPESVLEHSAVVTLLSMLAGNIALQQGKSVDLAKMLSYAAYIKCKLEVAAGNGLEFEDALNKMEGVVAQVKKDFPEVAALDEWFGEGLGQSVDKLLSGGADA